jgi:hypothetical protein
MQVVTGGAASSFITSIESVSRQLRRIDCGHRARLEHRSGTSGESVATDARPQFVLGERVMAAGNPSRATRRSGRLGGNRPRTHPARSVGVPAPAGAPPNPGPRPRHRASPRGKAIPAADVLSQLQEARSVFACAGRCLDEITDPHEMRASRAILRTLLSSCGRDLRGSTKHAKRSLAGL